MEETTLKEESTSEDFFDAFDDLDKICLADESDYDFASSSQLSTCTPPPPVETKTAHLRRRRHGSSFFSSSTDSVTRESEFLVGSETATSKLMQDKLVLDTEDDEHEGKDRVVSDLASDPSLENSRDDRVGTGEVSSELEAASSVLVYFVGLLIKTIVFQIDLAMNTFLFPFRMLYFTFLLVTDPFGTLKSMRDRVIQKLERTIGILRDTVTPLLLEWVTRQDSIGKLAVRLAVGCFWSFYVCFVLFGCLLTAFLIGRLLMHYVLEEPVEVTGDLNFDYTKDSPVAFVPTVSCDDDRCGFDCGDVVQVGKNRGWRQIPQNHKLKLIVYLRLPESDYNRKLGIFQVRVEFATANGKVGASSSRPCMLKFKSSPIRYLETAFKTAPLVAGYSSETQIVKLEMMKGFTEKADPTTCIRVYIDRRAEYRPGTGIPEIYAASVKLESELPFFKRVMWKWRRTLFIWISMSLFISELLIILVCCRPLVIPRI